MKKFIGIAALILIAAMLVVGCSNDTTPEEKANGKAAKTYYCEVGVEKHSYFPYAVVSVDENGTVTDIEMGEAFGPSGKVWVESGDTAKASDGLIVAYNNAWSKGFKDLVTEVNKIVPVTDRDTYVNNNPVYIKIGDEILTTKFERRVYGNVRISCIVFANDKLTLSDQYLAEHMEWYLKAIAEDKVFECDSSGNKVSGFAPADKAFLKTGTDSDYQTSRGLQGPNFKKVMDSLAAYGKPINCQFEYEIVAGVTGNWDNLRVKGWAPEKVYGPGGPEVITGATATFLQYGASYAKVATKAYNLALSKGHL